MRKKSLFVIVMLLLTLTLLPITPTAAVGPKPRGKATVTFEDEGDITGSALNFDVGLHGKLTIVYGDVNLKFVESYEGDWWLNFGNEGKLGIRIDKRTGEAHIIYMFDEYVKNEVPKRYEGAKKYQLEKYGTFSEGSIPYGTVEVANEGFIIYQIKYQETTNKNGKGAFGVTYDDIFSGTGLSFTINIEEV